MRFRARWALPATNGGWRGGRESMVGVVAGAVDGEFGRRQNQAGKRLRGSPQELHLSRLLLTHSLRH
jgi:hypothetical protein